MIAVYIPTSPLSKPAPYQPTDPELTALVQQATSRYPDEAARIRRGAEIVEKGGVRVREDGVYLVGVYHHYPQVHGQCSCPDSMLGHAPECRCKHKWAQSLYRKLHAAPAPTVRTKTFQACLDDTVGIVTITENGGAHFAPYDASVAPWALSDYEIVYTLVLGRELRPEP